MDPHSAASRNTDVQQTIGVEIAAITAMAHRLARLVCRMLKYGQQFVDKGMEYYEQRYRNQQVGLLQKKQLSSDFKW